MRLNPNRGHIDPERGAALLMMLLISMLIMTVGAGLILTTGLSATNSIDATSEVQAFYAAEAGVQATMNVLRGNVAPSPLFDTSSSTASANKITFRKAVTASTSNLSTDANGPRLSRWLSYDSTYTDRIPLTSSYSPVNGLAYSTSISDPDSSATVAFTVSGAFSDGSTSKQIGSGGNRATLQYTAPSATTINTSGSANFGKIVVTFSNGSVTLNEPFTITIAQTAPWASTVAIACTLTGTITSTSNPVTVVFTGLSNSVSGTSFTRTATSLSTNSTTTIPVTVTAPEPQRLLVSVTGMGPRGAQKKIKALVSLYAFDFSPTATITLRGSDSGGAGFGFAVGNSAAYTYTGNDNAGGSALPAFAVTTGGDYSTANSQMGGQITGNPPLSQVSTNSLPSFLQSADNARALVDSLRTEAQNEGRYYTTTSPPTDFGATSPNGLFTFVDGDIDLGNSNGAGILVVTGTLTLNGNAEFDGIILVLGTGQVLRNGGGNGITLGSITVASFGSTGGFTEPTFNSNGSGTSDVKYDSNWTSKALKSAGPRVIGVSEF